MNKVLITGANGFIGRHTLPQLMNRDYEVHAVTSKSGPAKTHGPIWHVADLTKSEQIEKLIEIVQPSHLLHFAWDVNPKQYRHSINNFTWVQASLELVKHFKSCGGRRAVLAGTCAEYDWNFGYCSEFLTPLQPANSYGVCKNALRMIIDAYAKETGLSTAWGRIFYLFGPHEHQERLVPYVIRSLLAGDPVLCTDGKQVRDFLYVAAAAEAFVELMESDVRGPVNIGSGLPVRIRPLIEGIANIIGRSDLVRYGAMKVPEEEPGFLVADIRRLLKEVGWIPTTDLGSDLAKTIDWWRGTLRI